MLVSGQFRSILGVTFRWTAAWTVVGLLTGVWFMFDKVSPIAEPGAPSNIGFYSFWIPMLGGVGCAFGIALGLLYACLMALLKRWMPDQSTNFMARNVPRLMCGATAGGVLGLSVTRDANALWFAGLGLCSAVVAGTIKRRTNGIH